MKKTGRNDSCPCGSGLKYKKCCLEKEELLESRRRDEERAVQSALSWLAQTYPEEASQAFYEEFFGEMSDEEQACLDALSPGLQEMVNVNSSEWMLADGDLFVDGEMKPVIDLVLGPGGPLLPVHGRSWLKALGEFPMSLYEVRESKPGEGLQVVDLLCSDSSPVWVRERSASKSLFRWDIFGGRLARKDDAWVFSGAMYPFEREEGLCCRDEILDTIEVENPCDEDRRIHVGTIIIDTWLFGLLESVDEPLPTIVDAGTQESIMLTTDHYRVIDWDALEKALATEDDVEGDRIEGWTKFVELADGSFRSLAALNPKKPDSIEVFCRTIKLADEARSWLEGIGDHALKYKVREIVDPRSIKSQKSAQEPRHADIPSELETQLVFEMLTKHYESWPDTPLPALDGKTPHEAVMSAVGRSAVVELLKEFELREARKVRNDGGEPFDYGFLWQRLGLEAERD